MKFLIQNSNLQAKFQYFFISKDDKINLALLFMISILLFSWCCHLRTVLQMTVSGLVTVYSRLIHWIRFLKCVILDQQRLK